MIKAPADGAPVDDPTKLSKQTNKQANKWREKLPADGAPVDDPAKLSATSSATSWGVCSPVGANLGFFFFVNSFLFHWFINAFFWSSMMDLTVNTKSVFTGPPYFQHQTDKTTAELLANWYHHHQERIYVHI